MTHFITRRSNSMMHRQSLKLDGLNRPETKMKHTHFKKIATMLTSVTDSSLKRKEISWGKRRLKVEDQASLTTTFLAPKAPMSRMITSCKLSVTSLKSLERVMNHSLSLDTAISKSYMLYKIMQTCLRCKTMTCKKSLTNSSWPTISSEQDSIARHALTKWKTEMWCKSASLWHKWINLAHHAATRQAARHSARANPTTTKAA